jgi:hypothetical protein
LVLLSVKLVQPGMLGDVVEGIHRLLPTDVHEKIKKEDIKTHLERLKALDLVFLYEGRRYMLTDNGRDVLFASGIKQKMDARRLHLLKETRRDSYRVRSDARDRSLKQ